MGGKGEEACLWLGPKHHLILDLFNPILDFYFIWNKYIYIKVISLHVEILQIQVHPPPQPITCSTVQQEKKEYTDCTVAV